MSAAPDHLFTIPAGLSPEEDARLRGLADAFWGLFLRDGKTILFTPVRGRKFELFLATGFSYVRQHAAGEGRDKPVFSHPDLPYLMEQSRALKVAECLARKEAACSP